MRGNNAVNLREKTKFLSANLDGRGAAGAILQKAKLFLGKKETDDEVAEVFRKSKNIKES